VQAMGGSLPSASDRQTRLAPAQQLKAEGNALHRAKRFEEAAAKYEEARRSVAGAACLSILCFCQHRGCALSVRPLLLPAAAWTDGRTDA
jgi:hypothetical protein